MKKNGNRRTKSYSSDLYLAVVLFCFSVSSIYLLSRIEHRYALIGISLSIGFIPLSIWVGKQYFQRNYGISVEKKALDDLNFPETWKVEKNVPTRLGDCDLLVTSPSGQSCVIEIKAYNGLRTNLFGKVVKLNGKPCLRDPVDQAIALKALLRADRAIVWCPRSKTSSKYSSKGVSLINGSQSKLKSELGIRSFFGV